MKGLRLNIKLVSQGADITMVNAGRVPSFKPETSGEMLQDALRASNFLKGGTPACRMIFTGSPNAFYDGGDQSFDGIVSSILKRVEEVLDGCADDGGEYFKVETQRRKQGETVWLMFRITCHEREI